MRQAGVEVRPLREMTGRALFNEVFLTDARVPHDHVIGDVNDGWKVANTTLMVERQSIGGSTPAAFTAAVAGTVAGHLAQPAGKFTRGEAELGGAGVGDGRVQAADRAGTRDAASSTTRRSVRTSPGSTASCRSPRGTWDG